MRTLQKLLLTVAILLPIAGTGGCSTIAGTAVSPITGGINLTERYFDTESGRRMWYWTPFVFIGGAVAGPIVALYNGVRHDWSIFQSWRRYWRDFDEVFAPYDMIARKR
jgi:hypothetical protein